MDITAPSLARIGATAAPVPDYCVDLGFELIRVLGLLLRLQDYVLTLWYIRTSRQFGPQHLLDFFVVPLALISECRTSVPIFNAASVPTSFQNRSSHDSGYTIEVDIPAPLFTLVFASTALAA